MEQTGRLRVKYEYSTPMDLSVLTDSMRGLSDQFARHVDRRGAGQKAEVVKLRVEEVRSGSVEFIMSAVADNAVLLVPLVNQAMTFAKHTVEILRFFKGDTVPAPSGLTVRDAENAAKIVGPTAEDQRGMFIIQAGDSATVSVNLTLNSHDANVIRNRSKHWASLQSKPISGVQTNQVFYFFQARDERQADAGDRGIIEAISSKPVKTIFVDDFTKDTMLSEALFRKAYIVDVDVQTVDGKPRLYRILRVSESFDRDAGAD